MQLNRNYEETNFITSLRAIAISTVVLIHYGGFGLREYSVEANRFVDWGKFGVSIFFVISRYTIFHQVINRKYTLKDFLFIRILRLATPYFPILLLLFIFPEFINKHWSELYSNPITIYNWLTHITFINFISIEYMNTLLGVEWTLSIEFFYYVILGFILTRKNFTKNINRNMIILLFIFIVILNIGENIANNKQIVDNYLSIHWSPILYGYMFIMGGGAVIIRKKIQINYTLNIRNSLSNLLIILIPIIIIINLHIDYFKDIELLYVYLTVFSLIFIVDESLFGKLLNNKIFIYVGSISYSLYLWHFIFIQNSSIKFDTQLYNLIAVMIISTLWYMVFEKLIYIKLKRKIKNDK